MKKFYKEGQEIESQILSKYEAYLNHKRKEPEDKASADHQKWQIKSNSLYLQFERMCLWMNYDYSFIPLLEQACKNILYANH